MGLTELTNKELAYMYVTYKQQLKIFKQRTSFYDFNKCIEIKKYLSIVKWEMKRRGLKKKEAKKLGNKKVSSTSNFRALIALTPFSGDR